MVKQITDIGSHDTFETWELDSGLSLSGVHNEKDCTGRCVFHNPTKHHMAEWRLYWRDDRSIFERICQHGIGHPDPDQFSYWKATGQDGQEVHGCDGCCHPPKRDRVPASQGKEE